MLFRSESEIIEIRQKVIKLNRELEQQVFTQTLMSDIEVASNQASNGSQAVLGLSAVLRQYGSKVKSDAEREKLLSLTADLSQISSRFYHKPDSFQCRRCRVILNAPAPWWSWHLAGCCLP